MLDIITVVLIICGAVVITLIIGCAFGFIHDLIVKPTPTLDPGQLHKGIAVLAHCIWYKEDSEHDCMRVIKAMADEDWQKVSDILEDVYL